MELKLPKKRIIRMSEKTYTLKAKITLLQTRRNPRLHLKEDDFHLMLTKERRKFILS